MPQLDGLNFDLYCDVVLPRVMEQIISCKDDIAQQYLMQAVIQVSPSTCACCSRKQIGLFPYQTVWRLQIAITCQRRPKLCALPPGSVLVCKFLQILLQLESSFS